MTEAPAAEMLVAPVRRPAPYALVTFEAALPDARCDQLEALFTADLTWKRHADELYECGFADVTTALDRPWLTTLTQRVAGHLQMPLTDAIQVTTQRMEPGDRVGRHNDEPRLGYEAARLVVQLDRGWAARDGGRFRAFAGERVVLESLPSHNRAAAFALTRDSFHEVSETRRARHSVVFHFWHRGNTSALQAVVCELFDGMSFGALPAEVLERADVADAQRPESETHRAASVAVALLAWGFGPSEAARGYSLALHDSQAKRPTTTAECELERAAGLACWLHRLYGGHFDAGDWAKERDRLGALEPPRDPRLREAWRVAFG